MAEELTGVLREVSVLLQRLTEQNDATMRRQDEMRSRFEANREPREAAAKRLETLRAERPDLKARNEELRKNMEESRVLHARQREEDVQFRQRLLQEIERHNQLLETLITKLGS